MLVPFVKLPHDTVSLIQRQLTPGADDVFLFVASENLYSLTLHARGRGVLYNGENVAVALIMLHEIRNIGGEYQYKISLIRNLETEESEVLSNLWYDLRSQ